MGMLGLALDLGTRAQGGGITSLPGISSPYYAVRAMRRLVPDYAGPAIRVRSSGAVESDINFLASGELDYTTLNAVAAPTLVTMYDQTGNGFHLTQATAGSQPVMSALGDYRGRRPAMFPYAAASSRILTCAGMSVPRPDHTHFMVLDPELSAGGDTVGNGHHEFYNGVSTNYDSLYTTTAKLKGNAGGSLMTAAWAPASMPQVMALISRGSGRVLRSQNKRSTGAVLAAQAMTNQRIGASTFGANFRARQMRLWADIVIAAGISDGEADAVQSALESLFNLPLSYTSAIHLVGNSLDEGWNSTFLQNSYFNAAFSGSPRVYNYGIGGKLESSMITDFAAYIVPNIEAGMRNVLADDGGSNDIAAAVDPAVLYASLTAYHAAARAAGMNKIVRPTILPRTGFDVAPINALILANTVGADRVVDFTVIPGLTDPTNATYFDPDQIHLTNAGHALRGAAMVGGVNAVLA